MVPVHILVEGLPCSKMPITLRKSLLAGAVMCGQLAGLAHARTAAEHLQLAQPRRGGAAVSSHTRSLAQVTDEEQQRIDLANHAAGVNLVFYEVSFAPPTPCCNWVRTLLVACACRCI